MTAFTLGEIETAFRKTFGSHDDMWQTFQAALIPTPLHFPNVVKLALERNVSLYLDGCKVHRTLSGKLCLVGLKYGDGYFGTFTNNGHFNPTRSCTKEFIAQLEDVEKNGVDAAKRIGKLTGFCCVCGRTLTNEGSIADGIGPICAGKFDGLGSI